MYWSLQSGWKIAYCVDILFITLVYRAYKARREARIDPETSGRTLQYVGVFQRIQMWPLRGESLLWSLFLWMV